MAERDRRLVALGTDQHGAFSRAQVLALGFDDKAVSRRLRSGGWVRLHPGVYCFAGSSPSSDRRLWAAHLAVGPQSIVSHECAAERQGLRSVVRGRLVLTSRHGRHHRIPDVFVHQLDDVLPQHVELVGGIPTTTLPRTLVDCAAVLGAARLDRLVEEAIRSQKVTPIQVHEVVAVVQRKGKPGMKAIGRALHRFGPAEAVPESRLEELLLAAVVAGGNPRPVAQFPHPGRHPGVGRVDFAYPDAKVVLEADGRTWHQRVADVLRDRSRDNEAAREGWLTLRFMWEHLRDDAADVGATVRDVLATRFARR